VVVCGGVVSGTWERKGDAVQIGWFRESGKPPAKELGAEVDRLSKILDRSLSAEISMT
jgi:hypothetical protein